MPIAHEMLLREIILTTQAMLDPDRGKIEYRVRGFKSKEDNHNATLVICHENKIVLQIAVPIEGIMSEADLIMEVKNCEPVLFHTAVRTLGVLGLLAMVKAMAAGGSTSSFIIKRPQGGLLT